MKKLLMAIVRKIFGIKTDKNGNEVVLCPWHIEKTGSLVLYHDKKTFHCVGCGKKGTISEYIDKINSL